ncbi:MAG: hypothetical protein NNA31_10875 [Nitrospira sp.]|nr:hypothetical protein [Nitrospira sp.]
MIGQLPTRFHGDLVDSLKNSRGLPMKANNLNLAIHTFRNGKNDFVQGAAGNEKFFADTIGNLKCHV